MSDLYQGQSADIVLNAGDSVRVSTVGQVTVKGVYGAPTNTTTLNANTQVFGPYQVPAKLTVTAVSGTANYAQPTQVPVTVNPSTNEVSPAGAVSGAGKAVQMGVFADSVGDQQFGTVNSLANNVAQARGSLWHWNALIGGKVRISKNYSVSGTNSGPWSYNTINNGGQDWLSRYQAVLADMQANGIGYLYFGYPHNDGVFGVPAATTISNLRTMLDAFRLAGITLLVADRLGDSRTPNGSAPAGTTQQTIQAHNNTVGAWIDAYCRQYGISRYRQHSATADPTTDAPITNYAFDASLHPSSLGAGAIAYDNRGLNFPLLPRHEFPGALNWRNGCANGGLLGTGGTATGVTGTVPDGWTAYVSGSPSTPVCGTAARTDGRPGNYLTLTSTAGAAGDRIGITQAIQFNQPFTVTTYTAATKGSRIRGSYGDHWVVTTVGTSSGTEPAAMAAASNLGDTCTSGTVTYTRVETINPGDLFEVIVAGQVYGASSATLGCMPTVLVNISGSNTIGGLRFNNPNGTDLYPTCYQAVGSQFTGSTSGSTTLTVTAMAAGSAPIAIGQTIVANGVILGTVTAFGSGSGGTGTYTLSASTTASGTMYGGAPSSSGDWVARSTPAYFDGTRIGTYAITVFVYLTMSNGLTATLALSSVELVKIASA